jgi:3-dehydrosphinganine reductase
MTVREYFAGKSVMITGGSSGIGLAFAKCVAALGAHPTLMARRNDRLISARTMILESAPDSRVSLIPLDITQKAAVEDAVARHIQDAGDIDILVNNAGYARPGRFAELPDAAFRDQMEVNYFGAVYVTRSVLPHMLKRRSGHIVNVSSIAGVLAIYGYTSYAASKFALLGFSQALRAEVEPASIRVSVCFPPDTDTPQLAYEREFKPPETRAITGTFRPISPVRVANAMARGAARGQFEIYPDVTSRFIALSQRLAPGVLRWSCDRLQKKAGRTKG